MNVRSLALSAACLAALVAPAIADTNVTILHVNENPAQRRYGSKIAKDYNAAHKGVKVEIQISRERGVQGQAADDAAIRRFAPEPVLQLGRRRDGGAGQGRIPEGHHRRGRRRRDRTCRRPRSTRSRSTARSWACRWTLGEVAFFYNKKLFEKAGVKAEDIKSWDDFLAAVKKLKAAGITPLVVGAGEKWPMHFYYSYLVMRIGGEHALADAKAGKDGGFKNATFVEAGKRLRELAALEPFQPGYLSTSHAPIRRHVRRRQGGDGPDGRMAAGHAGAEFRERQGPARGGHRHPVVPGRARRQGQGDRHARRRPRLARHQDRAEGGRRFPQILQPGEIRERPRRKRAPTSPSTRARRRDHRPARQAASPTDLAATTYHQNFFDQDLGPSVGRVDQRHLGRGRRRAR